MFTLYICKIWGVSFFKSIPHRIHFTEYTRYPEYSFNAEPWNLYLKKLNSKKKKGKKFNKIINNRVTLKQNDIMELEYFQLIYRDDHKY